MELTKTQISRLINVGRKIWKMLTPDEQSAYYVDTGTIGFVETVAELLHLDLYTVSLKDFEAIHNAIIPGCGRNKSS
jgi:hypothetical protein